MKGRTRMEKGMGIDELAATMPLEGWITITDAAKILGGGATRIKALMDLVMTGGLFSWSHSCPHMAPTEFTFFKIGLTGELPPLAPDTDPSTVLIESKEILWRWCLEVEMLLRAVDDDKLPPKERVTARLQALQSRAYELKTGTGPASPTTPAGRWPWGSHHTKALGHLEAAAKQWWFTYDPDQIDTAPRNQDVIDWLVKEREVSRTLAEAMASILRVDGLKTGPR